MAVWYVHVQFRDLLENYDGRKDELKEIKRIKPLWKKRFETIPHLKHFTKTLFKVKTEAGFNKWLNTVFDYCDEHHIWVDFK